MIINAKDLELSYDNKKSIIQGGNFIVNEKDFIFIGGASGSGKSTLLKSLYAKILPTNGQLIVDTHNIRKLSSKNQELDITSKYEDRWKKQGKNIYDLTLVSKENSLEKDFSFDFSFDKEIDFKNLKSYLNRDSIIKKDFFVHFEDILSIDDDKTSGLIALTFGSFNAPITKYLEVKNNNVKYFQGPPIPTTPNYNAHKLIKEMLNN